MTTTCLISNFNYAHFVGSAVAAALRQTAAFDEIIVVDDGSTDGSINLLKDRYGRHSKVRIIAKDNGGQLSCFNEGFAQSRGEIIFFLDADDVYEPHYVDRALDAFQRDPHCDFLICGRRLFGNQEGELLTYPEDCDLGYSVILTAYLREWIGGPTSCLSMRRELANKILPLPLADDWRVRADDCLVFGSSLAGARKRYLAQPLVRYRVHGKNHFRGRAADAATTYRRRLAMNRLFEHLERKFGYNFARLADFHHREFCTIERPTLRQLRQYVRISGAAQISVSRRLGCVGEMVRHYMRPARRPVAGSPKSAERTADRVSSPHFPLPVHHDSLGRLEVANP